MKRGSPAEASLLGRIWLYLLGAATIAFLLAPSLVVIPMSFSDSRFLRFPPAEWSLRWYGKYVSSPEWLDATMVSFKTAALTMLLSTVLGTAAAYGLHAARIRTARIAYVLFLVPLVIPVILLGVGIFLVYAQLGLNNTIAGLVLGHSVLAIPLVVLLVSAGLRSYSMDQEMVARSLGATRFWAFLTVTLPQIRFSVVSGALLAFITSFDEVVIALFVAGGEATTLTKRMFSALRDEIDPTIAAISTLLTLMSIVAVATSQLVKRQSRS